MNPTLRSLGVSLCLLACSACSSRSSGPVDGGIDASAPDASPPDASPPVPVQGELQLVGLVRDASAVSVELVHYAPTVVPLDADAGAPTAPPAPGRIPAVVSPTADPHVLTFQADDLPAGQVYQVNVTVADSTGLSLVWRGPSRGLVVAGAAPARFDGLAIRTHLRILADHGDGPAWRRAARLDPAVPQRTFRLSTDVAGVIGADIQVSTERFPVDELWPERACAEPPGLRWVEHTELGDNPDAEFQIDLSTVLATPPTDASPLLTLRHRQVLEGAPLYLRVVPRTADGLACDPRAHGASSWVQLSVAHEPIPDVLADPPRVHVSGQYARGAAPRFDLTEQLYTCYRVIADHVLPQPGDWLTSDLLGFVLLTSGEFTWGETVPAGYGFCLPPTSGGPSLSEQVVESFSEAFSTITSPIEWMVNRLAALYNGIRDRVVTWVAGALDALDLCAPADCRLIVQLAVETGLIAVGLPPSAPDFDTLAEEGLDYLAQEIATQVGVPSEVVDHAFDIAQGVLAQARATRGLGFAPYAVGDTGFRSTVLHLDLGRTSLEPPSSAFFLRDQPDLWRSLLLDVHVPVAQEGSLRVPLALQSDLRGLPAVPVLLELLGHPFYGTPQRVQAWYEQRWSERLAARTCVPLEGYGADRVPDPEAFIIREPYLDMALPNADVSFTDPFLAQCVP